MLKKPRPSIDRKDLNFRNRLSRRRKWRAEGDPAWKDKTDEELEMAAAQAGYMVHEEGSRVSSESIKYHLVLLAEILIYAGIYTITSDRLTEVVLGFIGSPTENTVKLTSAFIFWKIIFAVLEIAAFFLFDNVFKEIFQTRNTRWALVLGTFTFGTISAGVFFSYNETKAKVSNYEAEHEKWAADLIPLQNAQSEKAEPMNKWYSLYLLRRWPTALSPEKCETSTPETMPTDCQMVSADNRDVRQNRTKWKTFEAAYKEAEKTVKEHKAKEPKKAEVNKGALPLVLALWAIIILAKFIRTQYLSGGKR